MNNSNDYGHLRVRSNIVRLRGSQILSRVYLIFIFAFGDVEKVPNNRICKSLVLYSLLTIVLIEEVTRQNYMMADYVEKQNLYQINLFYIKNKFDINTSQQSCSI